MAADHEGWYLKANVDISSLLQANKATDELFKNIKKVDAGFSGLHGNDALAKSIKSADIETASYIDRLKSEGKTYEANEQKVNLYSNQITRLKNRQQGLVSELDKIAEKSGKNSDAFHVQKARINETAASINKLNDEVNKLHPTGFDRLTSSINKAERASGKIKDTLRSGWDNIKGGAYSAAAGIAAIGAAAVSGAKKAGNLQQTYKEIDNLAVLGGEHQRSVTKSIAEMQRQGRDMALKYGKSQQEIAEGYEDLVKRGYSTRQALGALRTEMQASVASGDKFSDVTTVSSQVIEAFGMKAKTAKGMIENTNKAVNMLAYSADATSTGFHSLGDSVHYFGAAAKAQHISLAESASAVGMLSNNGIEGSMGGTAMRDIIERIGSQVNGIGKKNSVFTKLGISTKEIEDSQGHLKSLADAMDVIWDHIKKHSQNSIQEQGFMKSIFGSTAQNAATILAQNTGELRKLTEETQKVGDKSTYVSKLAAKNSDTAKMQVARAKQAANAFKMELGAKLLPAINEAGNSLAKFLTTKDGKRFEKDVGGAVSYVANGLVKFIKWGTTHKGTLKTIGGAILAGYTVAKGLQFVAFLGDVKKSIDALKGSSAILNGIADATKAITGKEIAKKGVSSTIGGLFNKGAGAGKLTGKGKLLNGSLQSIRSAGGLKGLTGAGRLATGASIAGIAVDAGYNGIYKAFKDRHNATKRSQDIGKGIGAGIGGGIGLYFGGPLGAALGAKVGGFIGKWGGEGVNQFTKGWQRQGKNKKPKNWVQWLGFQAHNSFDFFAGLGKKAVGAVGKAVNKAKPFVRKNWKEMALTAVAPWAGIPALLYKNNPKFHKWANKAGKTIQNGFKGAVKWVKDLPSNIHKGWNNAIKSSHKFFKSLPKNIDKTKRNIGKWASKTGKDIGSAWRKGQKATVSFVKHIPSNLGKAQKSVERWGRKTGKNIGSAWHKGTTAVGKFVGSIPGHLAKAQKSVSRWADRTGKNIHGVWDKGKQGLTSFVTSIPRMLGKAYSAVIYWAGKVGKTVKNAWNGFWGKAGDIRKGVTNNVKAFGNDLAFASGHSKHTFKYEKIKSHASGGRITASHHALVGEAGPELAYKPYSNNVRLLGANGPQFTRIRAGEKILNAKDTRKVMSGGLGRGLILKGYASGNTKLSQTTKTVSKDYKSITSNATKQLTKLDRTSKSKWRGIASNSTKQSSKTRKSVVSDYTKMHKSVDKQMDNMHRGVVKTATATSKGFGKAMDKMTGYAKDTMSDTIGQLNKGIRGIDKVIGEFGGDASAIKPVHFATGSNGALPHNTLAMVNDAPTGPRQESIVRGNNLIIPSGKDRVLPLQKGDKVLNGHQTQEMAESMGLPHFAKGSGVGHAELKQLYNIAKQNWKQPEKTGRAMFKPVSGLQAGAKVLADSANETGVDQGVKYWSSLWGLAQKKVDDSGGETGPASGLLKAVERYGEGHKYVWGATGPSAFDCSGLVMYALKHAYGIDYPHFSGSQYARTQHISKGQARMGDLVFWGANGSEHVGVYAGGSKYFSAESPAQGIHMNTLSSVVGKGAPLFGRVKGANTQGSLSKGKVSVKTNSTLDRFVKNSAGPGFWKTMQKIGDEFGEGGGYGNPAGDGVARWRKYIVRAAHQMHASVSPGDISKIMSMISAESSGNPTITQQIQDVNSAAGDPAQGLLQFIPPTFNAYAVKGHRKIKNGYDQLLALFNDRNWRSDIHYGGGWGPTGGRRFAKGGTHHGSGAFLVGEEGPEILNVPGDVKIDDHQTTRRKLRSLAKDFTPAKPGRLPNGKPIITININFNGNVGNSKQDADQVANMIEVKIAAVLEKYFGHEFGSDPSLY